MGAHARRRPGTRVLLGVLGSLIDVDTPARVLGRDHLTALQAPVVFVANHSSHMDTPGVHIGPPIRPRESEHAREVMERVRLFFEASGAVTTPDKRVESGSAA